MQPVFKSGLATLIVVGLLSTAGAQDPADRPADQPQRKTLAPRPALPKADEVLATINGEPITRGDLFSYLGQYQLPPGNEEQVYEVAMNQLVNTQLVVQYLQQQGLEVTDEEINEEIDEIRRQVQAQGSDLDLELAQAGVTIEDYRHRHRQNLLWRKFIQSRLTDEQLRRYYDENQDTFSGDEVRASHILISVDPAASDEEKEQARQKIEAIKEEIESGQINFAEAANRYSEDPGNEEKVGGDLGFFRRKGRFFDKFAAEAFRLNRGAISEPLETPFGYHLIQVTDRRQGEPVDFEEHKPLIARLYENDLLEQVVEQARETADIEIQPLPDDLFPPAPATEPVIPPRPPGGGAAPEGAVPPR